MIIYSVRKRIANNFYWWCNENNAVKSVENVVHYLYLHGFLNEEKILDVYKIKRIRKMVKLDKSDYKRIILALSYERNRIQGIFHSKNDMPQEAKEDIQQINKCIEWCYDQYYKE